MKLKKDFVYGILVGAAIALFLIILFNMPLTDIGFYPNEGIIANSKIAKGRMNDDIIIGCASSPEIVRNTSTCISVLKQSGWSDEKIRDKNVYCDYSNITYHEPVCMWDGFDLEDAIKRWEESPKAYAG